MEYTPATATDSQTHWSMEGINQRLLAMTLTNVAMEIGANKLEPTSFSSTTRETGVCGMQQGYKNSMIPHKILFLSEDE